MRCPTCGTENEADSRFCGGCGARLAPVQSRVAPTHKIPDDAPLAPPTAAPASVPAGPVSYAPPSIPPAAAPVIPPHAAAPVIATPVPGSLVRPPSQPSPYATPASEPPASAPPASQSPASNPPQPATSPSRRPASEPGESVARRQPPAPQLTSDSLLVPPRRPAGLIALVLIVDLGLAAAGSVLLVKGLAAKQTAAPASDAPAETATERKSEAPLAASTGRVAVAEPPAAPASIEGVAAAASPPAAEVPQAAPVATPPEVHAETKRENVPARTTNRSGATPKTSAAKAKASTARPSRDRSRARAANAPPATASGSATEAARVTAVPSASQDPYPDPAREIDAKAARAQPAFARCAAQHGPAHGTIQVAFQVRPDGRIANAAAVENSTGNTELARCLVAEIASWRVSAHGGATIDMFRPFTYP